MHRSFNACRHVLEWTARRRTGLCGYGCAAVNALFRIENGCPQRLCPDRAISLAALAEELSRAEEIPLLVGDGAVLAEDYFRTTGLNVRLAPEPLQLQSAWGVAREAEGKAAGGSQELLPVYLRLSQAERERQAKIARAKEQV